MHKTTHSNIARMLRGARQLKELVHDVVFAGGAVTGLLITDPAVSEMRITVDVEVIVEAITRTYE